MVRRISSILLFNGLFVELKNETLSIRIAGVDVPEVFYILNATRHLLSLHPGVLSVLPWAYDKRPPVYTLATRRKYHKPPESEQPPYYRSLAYRGKLNTYTYDDFSATLLYTTNSQ